MVRQDEDKCGGGGEDGHDNLRMRPGGNIAATGTVRGGAAARVPKYLVRSEVPGKREGTIPDHELVSHAMHQCKKRKLAEDSQSQKQGRLADRAARGRQARISVR